MKKKKKNYTVAVLPAAAPAAKPLCTCTSLPLETPTDLQIPYGNCATYNIFTCNFNNQLASLRLHKHNAAHKHNQGSGDGNRESLSGLKGMLLIFMISTQMRRAFLIGRTVFPLPILTFHTAGDPLQASQQILYHPAPHNGNEHLLKIIHQRGVANQRTFSREKSERDACQERKSLQSDFLMNLVHHTKLYREMRLFVRSFGCFSFSYVFS
jgi:hypothetical protein